MENQHLSLLDRVYTVLRKRGEETEWITSADDHNIKTGIAFVPCDTFTPVSLLYTMIERPETLVIDVLFAAKVPENRRVEVSIILSELNADQTAGAFQLDPNSGYVYYRQSFVLEGMDLTEAQFAQLMKNIETQAKMISILVNSQPGRKQEQKITLSEKKLRNFFSDKYTVEDMESVILELLDQWKRGEITV